MSTPAKEGAGVGPAIAFEDVWVGFDEGQVLQGVTFRVQQRETLVLMGIATSGVVLSTLLHATDADYRVIVVKDCCTDQDPEVHACLTGKIFPRLGTVTDAAELIEALRAK